MKIIDLVYPNYKNSCIEWVGMIPEHWEVSPGLTCYEKRKRLNTGMVEDTVLSISYGRIVIRPPEKLTGLVPESFETYQLVDPGDIIIRPTDLQNDWNTLRTAIARDRGIITSAYLRLRAIGDMNPEYLRLVLHTYDLLKVYYGMGSGLRQNLDYKGDFKRLPIVIPPRTEQDRIVAFLDGKTREIDDAIAKKQRLIELLQEQKAILINNAVTKGLDPDVPMRESGVEWIGSIPDHWETLPLKRIVNTKITDGPHETPRFVDKGIPFVSVEAAFDGKIHLDKARGFIERKDHLKYSAKIKPQNKDIFIVKSGSTTGKVVIVDFDAEFSIWSPLALVRPNHKQFDAIFLFTSLQDDYFQKQIHTGWSKGTQPNIGMGDLENLLVIRPPLDEQIEIMEKLETQFIPIDLAIIKSYNEIYLLNEFKTVLIASAVTGKIKV